MHSTIAEERSNLDGGKDHGGYIMTANQIAYQRALEEQRSNQANESLKRVQNEIAGRNVAVAQQQARTDARRASEQARHNVATENQAASELAERHRSNKVNEGVAISNAVTGGLGNVLKGIGSIIPG